MTDRVTVIESFDTSLGKIITVVNDRLYRVGQEIETSEGIYRINAIHFSNNPSSNIIAIGIESINSTLPK